MTQATLVARPRRARHARRLARFKEWLWLLVALPSLTIVGGLFFLPFLQSFASSFQQKDTGAFTLNNYGTVGQLYLGDFVFTLFVSIVSLLMVLAIGIGLAGFLRLYSSHAIEFIFKIPLFVPFVVVGHAMRVFLAPHGLLNSGLAQIHLVDLNNPPSIAYTWLGISVSLAWKNMAFALLLVLGAFRSVKESYLEAARNFGAGWLRQIVDVLLPMSATSLAVAAVLIFTSMFASFSIPLMIGAGGDQQMLMIDIYYRIVYQNDLGVANALGVLAYIAASGAALYYLRSVSKET